MADEEIISLNETVEQEQEQELPVIETKGKWRKFEVMINRTLEVGKTYRIKINGDCLLAVSAERPVNGLKTNVIEYTKEEGTDLWVYTK